MPMTKLKLVPKHPDGRDPDLYLIQRVETNAIVGQYEGFYGRAKTVAEKLELQLLRDERR